MRDLRFKARFQHSAANVTQSILPLESRREKIKGVMIQVERCRQRFRRIRRNYSSYTALAVSISRALYLQVITLYCGNF